MNERTEGRYFMKPLPESEVGTPEGAAYETLRRGAAMTFLERLQWIEQVTTLFTGEVREGADGGSAAAGAEPIEPPER